MAIEILMPALSPTMTEGNLAKWHKKEGDRVKPGEIIAEIETDKATMEVEAVDSGTLGKILIAAPTAGVKVNQLIAVLLEAGDDETAMDAVIKKHAGAAAKAEPEATIATSHIPIATSVAPAAPTEGGRIFASPLAKRIAAQKGLDLHTITGTGPGGRIVKSDVLAASPSSTTAGSSSAASFGRNPQHQSQKPLSMMRRTIAQRLSESKQTIPHFYLTVDCQVDNLLATREQINLSAPKVDGKPLYRVSVNDFIIKACAAALARNPEANASWNGDSITYYNNVDISVAVAIPDGLITPIIQNADLKGLSLLSNEMVDLAKRARSSELKPHEYQGGSFTVSNLGMFGIKQFNAIVNPPQACIIAAGAVEKRPVVKDDQLVIAQVMTITLSCDHRVIDGAVGAQLLADIKTMLENPAMMLV